MALSGGEPKIVFVDEPTTGVDVGTRRFIWDRIKQASRDRVVVLTTHYMDEADALAQRIGIMAAGTMRVLGSPQHLKSRHGGGYRVELKPAVEAEPAKFEEAMLALVGLHFTDAKRIPSHHGTLLFEVGQGFALAKVFAAFESAKVTSSLDTFTMSQTSLEDVFLRVAEQHSPDAKAQVRGTASASEPLMMDRDHSNMQPGFYLNGWRNVWLKVTSDSPAREQTSDGTSGYKEQCFCFMYMWIIPVPCCCCPPTRVTRQLSDAELAVGEEGAEVYATRDGKTRHVWTAAGRYTRTSPYDTDKYKRVR